MLIKKSVILVTGVPLVVGGMVLIFQMKISYLLRAKVTRNTVIFEKGEPVLEVPFIVQTLYKVQEQK